MHQTIIHSFESTRKVRASWHHLLLQNDVLNLCLWECISSHFEAHFSIFYNLKLSKVRHLNTWVSLMFWKTTEPLWSGGDLKFEKKMLWDPYRECNQVPHGSHMGYPICSLPRWVPNWYHITAPLISTYLFKLISLFIMHG